MKLLIAYRLEVRRTKIQNGRGFLRLVFSFLQKKTNVADVCLAVSIEDEVEAR